MEWLTHQGDWLAQQNGLALWFGCGGVALVLGGLWALVSIASRGAPYSTNGPAPEPTTPSEIIAYSLLVVLFGPASLFVIGIVTLLSALLAGFALCGGLIDEAYDSWRNKRHADTR